MTCTCEPNVWNLGCPEHAQDYQDYLEYTRALAGVVCKNDLFYGKEMPRREKKTRKPNRKMMRKARKK